MAVAAIVPSATSEIQNIQTRITADDGTLTPTSLVLVLIPMKATSTITASTMPILKFRNGLDRIISQALQDGRVIFVDNDGDATSDDGNDLPRGNLDDEYLADSVEAYFNLRGGKGFTSPDRLCSSGGIDMAIMCNADRTSRSDLEDHHPEMFALVEEIFGSRETLFGQ